MLIYLKLNLNQNMLLIYYSLSIFFGCLQVLYHIPSVLEVKFSLSLSFILSPAHGKGTGISCFGSLQVLIVSECLVMFDVFLGDFIYVRKYCLICSFGFGCDNVEVVSLGWMLCLSVSCNDLKRRWVSALFSRFVFSPSQLVSVVSSLVCHNILYQTLFL